MNVDVCSQLDSLGRCQVPTELSNRKECPPDECLVRPFILKQCEGQVTFMITRGLRFCIAAFRTMVLATNINLREGGGPKLDSDMQIF